MIGSEKAPLASGEELHGLVRELVALGPRWCGEEPERQAAGWLANQFRQAGLSGIEVESFPVRSWRPLKAACHLDGTEAPCQAIWYSGNTPGGGVEAEVAYLGYGFDHDFAGADLKGKVVVVRSRILLNYYPTHSLLQTYRRAAATGAVGYVALLDTPPGVLPRYNHIHEDEAPFPLPGVEVLGDDARAIERMLSEAWQPHPSGRLATIRLEVEGRLAETETANVIGFLPGRTDRWVVVGSHYDSAGPGAVDNAAANAVLVALARRMAAGAPPERGLVFVAVPGHEVNIGTRAFVEGHRDLLGKTDCFLGLDGAAADGYSWWEGGVLPTGSDEQRGINCTSNPVLLRIARDALLRHRLLPAAYVPAATMVFNRDIEGRLWEAGVPFVLVIGKPIWYHTPADTPDKVSPERLERSFAAHLQMLAAILATSPGEIRAADGTLVTAAGLAALFRPGEPARAEEPAAVQAVWELLPERPHAGLPVLVAVRQFATDNVVLDVSWAFGDGGTGSGPATMHVYERPGRYRAELVILDDTGRETRFERVVHVE